MVFSRLAVATAALVASSASAEGDVSALLLVQHKATAVARDDDEEVACMKPGKTLFMHVMKNGGTSVDRYLACRSQQVHAGFKLSLGHTHLYEGEEDCKEPAVCSTHGEYRNRVELCGKDFEHPERVFTVMRDPVDRAFSMYNYEKAKLYAAKGEEMPPLVNMLKNCEEGTGTHYMCESLMNHMTLQTFAPKDNEYNLHGDQFVEAAQKTLQKMDAIFYMDNFDTFEKDFEKSGLLERDGMDVKDCKLTHSNPTDCPVCHDEPTKEEREALAKVNAMDAKLYAWAIKQPNYVGPAAKR